VTVLVDGNVLIDVGEADPVWGEWSRRALDRAGASESLILNPIIYAEVSAAFERIEEVEAVLPAASFKRDQIPLEAAFLAGKAYLVYRRRGRTSLPHVLSPAGDRRARRRVTAPPGGPGQRRLGRA